MKKRNLLNTLLAAFLLGTVAVAAQAQTTADDLVKLALERNGELQAARQMIAEVRGRLRQAGLKANPMLETSGTQSVNSPDNYLMLGMELPLELKGRRRARVDVAAKEIEVREAEVKDFERKLASDVRMKFSTMIAAQRNLRLTDDLLKLTRDLLRVVNARVQEGKSAPLEANLLAVELSRIEAMRIGADSQVEVAMLDLKKTIGVNPDEPLPLSGDFVTERQFSARGELILQALKNRPDLVAARAAEMLAAAQLEQVRTEGRVDASIFTNYQRMNLGYDVNGLNEAGALVPVTGVFHMLTFGVRLQLPTRNKNQGNIEAAVAAVDTARLRREFAEMVARNEVASAYVRFERAGSAITVYRENVLKQAEKNLEVIRMAYEFGQKTVLDYISEQRRFVELETGFTSLLKEAFDALIEIERAVAVSPIDLKGK
ncbi:MAG TPA: TolC family protein [Blastocatellia bacterium]|nr:TolC family protein [Blastocatellia bacterium]